MATIGSDDFSAEAVVTVATGRIGKYGNEYTYEGKDGKLDKIKVESAFKDTPPTGQADGSAACPRRYRTAPVG